MDDKQDSFYEEIMLHHTFGIPLETQYEYGLQEVPLSIFGKLHSKSSLKSLHNVSNSLLKVPNLYFEDDKQTKNPGF